ncbi:hypothetical protein WJX74_005628 [Apatococcus lobatus]|uniref:Protein kinase domain-containing protein n=1 Tax=Apatococcus lobatus TaxID=904363 RepID=A0AAW1R1S5_9CHLO
MTTSKLVPKAFPQAPVRTAGLLVMDALEAIAKVERQIDKVQAGGKTAVAQGRAEDAHWLRQKEQLIALRALGKQLPEMNCAQAQRAAGAQVPLRDGGQDAYLDIFDRMPPPRTFGGIWAEWNCPPNSPEPMFNIGRPYNAHGLAAALACEVFGNFLDRCQDLPVQRAACVAILNLSRDLCESYSSNTGAEAMKEIKRYLPDAKTKCRGGETTMMWAFRRHLLTYLQSQNAEIFPELEPASVSAASASAHDGAVSICGASWDELADSLLIVGKQDFETGEGSNPQMQAAACYAVGLASRRSHPILKETVVPAFGLEVVGNSIKVSALFFTNKICMEPLTDFITLMDFYDSQPKRMYYAARVLQAVCMGLQDLHQLYTKAEHTPAALPATDQSSLQLPDMFRRPSYEEVVHVGSNPRSSTWQCIKGDGSTTLPKITTAPYPSGLHQEAGQAGVVPQLRHTTRKYPGGQYLIEMDYLNPADGWLALNHFSGNWSAAKKILEELLIQWQACCNGRAVHGDLRAPNIFLRVDAAQRILEARFLDLAWAGEEGTASYPGFLSGRANWPLDDPNGKPMTQALDCKQLQDSLQLCQRAARARQRALRPEAASCRAQLSASHTKPSPRQMARQAKLHSPKQPFNCHGPLVLLQLLQLRLHRSSVDQGNN